MKTAGVYSLRLERLSIELQQCLIRTMLSVITCLVLIKYHFEPGSSSNISLNDVIAISSLFMIYSLGMWLTVKLLPDKLRIIMAASSFVEIILITLLIKMAAGTSIPFYLWYIFYVVNTATRYGWQLSVLALSASIVSFTYVVSTATWASNIDVPFVLGFIGYLLVLAFMFGQISERQLNYQAVLSVVNEFRAELAGLANSRDIIELLVRRAGEALRVETVFFLPAQRGSDASESHGLRSAGANPALLSAFREGGGQWNVESVLEFQSPMISNRPGSDLPDLAAKLGIRNIAAAPMMVRSVPVGVIYAVNRLDRAFSGNDLVLLEMIATQAGPVIENALLWERLREAAASEERLRIARDLHDNFLQTLAAIKLHLERCRILIEKNPPKALEGIERIHQIAAKGLLEVREYLSELRIVEPEPGQFEQTLNKLIEESRIKGGFEASIDIDPGVGRVQPEVALAAYQILRELLNNAAMHSRAGKVVVKLYCRDKDTLLDVTDDGDGFEVVKVRAQKASEGHLGLIGVEERAKQLSGSVKIISAPNSGTCVQVVLRGKED